MVVVVANQLINSSEASLLRGSGREANIFGGVGAEAPDPVAEGKRKKG